VTAISRGSQKITLSTPKGKVHTDKVVFATNAWSYSFLKLKSKQI
jgi:glycine/D-amino acid oxidase-like deaminating enzyme